MQLSIHTNFELYWGGELLQSIIQSSDSNCTIQNATFGVSHIILSVYLQVEDRYFMMCFNRMCGQTYESITQVHINDFLKRFKSSGEFSALPGILSAQFEDPLEHIQLFEARGLEFLLVVDRLGFSYLWRYYIENTEWQLLYNFNLIDITDSVNRIILKVNYEVESGILMWHENVDTNTSTSETPRSVGTHDSSNVDNRRTRIRYCYLRIQSADEVDHNSSFRSMSGEQKHSESITAVISHSVTIKSFGTTNDHNVSSVQQSVVDFFYVPHGCWITSTVDNTVNVYFYDFHFCTLLSLQVIVSTNNVGVAVNSSASLKELSCESKGSCIDDDLDAYTTNNTIIVRLSFDVENKQQTQYLTNTLYIIHRITGNITCVKRTKHNLTVLSQHALHNNVCSKIRSESTTSATENDSLNFTDMYIAYEDVQCAYLFLLTAQSCYLVKYAHETMDIPYGDIYENITNISNSTSGSNTAKIRLEHALSGQIERYQDDSRFVSLKLNATQSQNKEPHQHLQQAFKFKTYNSVMSDSTKTALLNQAKLSPVPSLPVPLISNTQQPHSDKETKQNTNNYEGAAIVLLCSETSVLRISNGETNCIRTTINPTTTSALNSMSASPQYIQFWDNLLESAAAVDTAVTISSAHSHHRAFTRSVAREDTRPGDIQRLSTSGSKTNSRPPSYKKNMHTIVKSTSNNNINILDMPMDQAFKVLVPPAVDSTVTVSAVDKNTSSKGKGRVVSNANRKSLEMPPQSESAVSSSPYVYGQPYPLLSPKQHERVVSNSCSDKSTSVTSDKESAASVGTIAVAPAPVTDNSVQQNELTAYQSDLLRYEEGLFPTLDAARINSVPNTSKHTRSRSMSNVSYTSTKSTTSLDLALPIVVTMDNIDDFINTCMAEYATRTTTAPNIVISTSAAGTASSSRMTSAVSTPLPTPTTTTVTARTTYFEPVFSLDSERDAELDDILREFICESNERKESEWRGTTSTRESSLAKESSDIRDLTSQSEHWIDTLDLVSLCPKLDSSPSVVNTIYELIGPFKLLELVKSLNPESCSIDTATVIASNKTFATYDTLNTTNGYSVELMTRRLLFSHPEHLFEILLYLNQVETNLKKRYDEMFYSALHDVYEEQSVQQAHSNVEVTKEHCDYANMDSSDDDEIYNLLFRDVGDDDDSADVDMEKTFAHHNTEMSTKQESIAAPTLSRPKTPNQRFPNGDSSPHSDDHSDKANSDDFCCFRTVHSESEDENDDDETEERVNVVSSPVLALTPEWSADSKYHTDEYDSEHVLGADLEPLSRRVSDNSMHLTSMSPCDLYRRHSAGESRIEGFTNMLELEMPASLTNSGDKSTGCSPEQRQSLDTIHKCSVPSSPEDRRIAVFQQLHNVSSTFYVALRDKLQLLAEAIVFYSIQHIHKSNGLYNIEDVVSSSDDHRINVNENEVNGDYDEQIQHYVQLSTVQQDCLLQILFLCGSYQLAIDAMFVWDRLHLLVLICIRISASANYLAHHYDLTAYDEFSYNWSTHMSNTRVFDSDYYLTGRGRFRHFEGFLSRPPLPQPIRLNNETAPTWSSAVGNTWDLGELTCGDELVCSVDEIESDGKLKTETTFQKLKKYDRIKPVDSFVEKRMKESITLFHQVLARCIQLKEADYIAELIKYRPKWITEEPM